MTSIFLSPAAARTTVNSVFSSAAAAAAASRTGRNRNRGSGGNAPLFFEHLGEVSRLKDGQARQIVDDFLQVSHCIGILFRFEPSMV